MYSYFEQMRSDSSSFGALPPLPPYSPPNHTLRDSNGISDTDDEHYLKFLGFFLFLELYINSYILFLLLLTVFILIGSLYFLYFIIFLIM